jgi:hypothetical protein
VEATTRTKGARQRRHHSGEGVGQPREEEVAVEPSGVSRSLMPEPTGCE